MLCYAGWWVTGLVFLFAERKNAAVRFHAAQSLVVFGALSVLLFLSGAAGAVALLVATPSFGIIQAFGNALWFGAVAMWLFLLLKTWRGETWRVPMAADLATRLSRT